MKSVWVIDAENKAAKTPIRTGAAYGNNWIVLNGLETGDRLIVEGTMMLRPGDLVKPKPIDAGYDDMNTDVPPNSLKNQSPPPNEPKTNSEQSQQDSLKSSVVNGSENSMEGKTDHSGTNQHTIEKR